jgi:hypothetical protein
VPYKWFFDLQTINRGKKTSFTIILYCVTRGSP